MNERTQKTIINVTRGTVVCEHAGLADRPLQRMRGLLGRSSMPSGEGLLLSPAPSVHTAFMRFAIDAVFLDRDLTVVKVVGALAPWRAASARRARAVLELPAGESARRGIRVGDRLACITEHEIPDGAMSVGPPSACPVTESGSGPRSGESLLLVSRDRRFRAVMAALLSARGFTVTMATRCSDPPDESLHSFDVVVVDAAESLAEAERDVRQLERRGRNVAVVFVSDDAGRARSAAGRVVPKWQSLEQLCDEIEAARSRTLGDLAARRAAAHDAWRER